MISWPSRVIEYTCIDPSCNNFSSELPHYMIFIELEEISDQLAMNDYAKQFDNALAKINPIYLSFREKESIGFPSVHIVNCGTFSKIRQDMIKAGTGINQVKIPRVTRYGSHIKILNTSKIEF